MPGNAVLVNFTSGETSPRSRGRFDASWYQSAARKLLNFIAELTGPVRFRSGFQFAWQTRQGQVARILTFQVNNNLAYLLEFTPGFMRVALASTQQLLTSTTAVITGISQASPGVVTVASATGIANGKELVLNGIVGMQELNGRQVIVANLVGNTFTMTDPVTSAAVNTTGLSAYVSGGTAGVVYEIATTYQAVDLPNLMIASTRSLAYLSSTTQPAQKITVDANNSFTIGSYSRTNDPFTSQASLTVRGITPGVLFDDFENGLGLWTTNGLISIPGILGSARATSLEAAQATPGYTSANMYGAQATGGAGNWEFDIVNTGAASDTVADTAGASFAGIVPAWVRFQPIWQNANNFYELRVYGAGMNSYRLYANIAGVASLVGTFGTGASVGNGSTHIKLKRDGAGVWTLTQDNVSLGTLTENTIVASARAYFYLSAPWTGYRYQIGVDNVFFPAGSATLKTIIWLPTGIVPLAGVQYTFTGVVGAVTINGNTYLLAAIGGSNAAYLKTTLGADVDSSGWGAYVSGGTAAAAAENPIGVTFYEGRLWFLGTNQRPDCIFGSRAPDGQGNSRYDDFTGGSTADFACFFQLAPTGGSTDYISWGRGGPDYMFVGTFGGPYRVSGSGLDIPITPSSINVRQFDNAGASATMPAGLAQMFFIQRGGTTLRSIKVINPYLATFESADMCLNAEQIGYSPLQRVVYQHGRPDSLWLYRADGMLCNMSVRVTQAQSETVAGWARHSLGGAGVALDLTITERTTGLDQLWVLSQRTINGAARCYVEVMADDVYFPDPEDFFSGSKNAVADKVTFNNILYRLSERYVHMDAAVVYNGNARPVAAAATLTVGAGYNVLNQAGVAVTTNTNVFLAGDVGNEIWKKPDPVTGVGGGRAVITGYTSAQAVTVTILAPFNSATAPASNWYIAASKISGAYHLEGQSIGVVTDGAVYADGGQSGDADLQTVVITNGTVTLTDPAAVVVLGAPYIGLLETHNLDMGGRTGPAQAKPRVISEMFLRFMNSLGCEYGTNIYQLSSIEDRGSVDNFNRVPPVFSGLRRLAYEDTTSGIDGDGDSQEKRVFVMQRKPLPAVLESIDVCYETTDEG